VVESFGNTGSAGLSGFSGFSGLPPSPGPLGYSAQDTIVIDKQVTDKNK
jgi:hypothetical protein